MAEIVNGEAPDRRSLLQRFWSRAGFGAPHVAPPDDEDGFAPGGIVSTVITDVDWADRIRILLSGRVGVQIRIQTDVIVGTAKSTARFSVLPPGGCGRG